MCESNGSEAPFISFGNDELNRAPLIGKTSPCLQCGNDCAVEDSVPPSALKFISCCGSSYLVAVDGKDVSRGRKGNV